MKIVWALLCETFVRDTDTNRLSIFNVIEEVRFLSSPPKSGPGETVHAFDFPFRLVASIVRSDSAVSERGSATVTMVGPDGLTHTTAEVQVNLSDFETYRIWFTYPGLPVSSAGIYKFLLDCKTDYGEWGEPFEVPLQVKLGPPLDI